MDPRFLVVGHVRKPHGTRGELVVEPLTDHPDAVFAAGSELRVSDAEGEAPDELLPPLRVEAARPHRGGLLVLFEGLADRDRAEFLRSRYLLRPFEKIEPLDEGELFQHQLLGLTVVTQEGAEIGTVREVYEHEPAPLLAVETPTREILVPFAREIILEWDLEAGRLVVDPPEGLLDL